MLLQAARRSSRFAAAAASHPLSRPLTISSRLAMAPTQAKKNSVPDGYREDMSKGIMYRFEDSLPRLPVPALEDTAKKYLKSVHPLLNDAEYARTSKAVEDFIKPGAIGQTLQKRLQARREDPNVKNWIYDWWNNAAYLDYRDPVVPYVSYFYCHRDDRKRRDQAKRAASLTSAALEYKRLVDNRELEPDFMRKVPIAMEQNQWLFNASRVAHEPRDYPVKFDPAENKHIVVMCRNQVWKVQHEINGEQLNTSELEKQFRYILDRAEKVPAVGALTSQNRDAAARSRATLLAASPTNADALRDVESASFVVCLDDSAPVTLEERAHSFWHGDGANRWYDKPGQIIVNRNGVSGFNGEHSMMDGTTTQRMNDFMIMLIATNKLDFDNPSIRSSLPAPTPVNFVVDESVRDDISKAQRDFDRVIGQHELKVQVFDAFGKDLIKKFKCSPDGFVQMVIQLAYYKMHGVSRPTYESAATRRFQQGRTETCRSVSDESVAWCKAMEDPTATDENRIKLFREAINSQGRYVVSAGEGQGVDRHLFGLKKELKDGEQVPDIYQDPTYGYSSKWFLSTSQLSSEYFNGYGWSQVTDEGFGIAYMINANSINFNIVSKKLGSVRLGFYLAEAANELADLLRPTIEHKAKI